MESLYLYIDDDSADRVSGTIQGFKQASVLDIVQNQPESTWEEQIQFIKEYSDSDKIDGLILDLRLDDYPNAQNRKANFRGTSLAQEIRTRQKEGNLKEFPIVLFSGNDKVENSLENSGKDLFDICIEKDGIDDHKFHVYRSILTALSNGYKVIPKEVHNLSSLFRVDYSTLDPRFVSEIVGISKSPSHIISRFLILEFIKKPGLLIDENYLAARLGIDKEKSKDWNSLLEILSPIEYNGIYSNGWRRWWMPQLLEWWENSIGAKTYLRSTSATMRVEFLRESIGLHDLYPSEKIAKSESDEFWTVCRGLNKPLDPVDGFVIEGQDNIYPWQDSEYVSIEAALRRTNIKDWGSVAKFEEERLTEVQDFYRKAHQHEPK